MKKFTVQSGIIIAASLLLQAQLGFAQNITGTVVSGEPIPATTTGGGANTTGTATTTTGTSTGTTRTGSQTGTTTGTNTGTRTPASTTGSQSSNLPIPSDIPIVPSITQETGTTTDQTTTLVCDQDKCAATVQKTMGNEIIVMTILFLGSGVGGLLWILALLMMKKGAVEREARRMDRRNRQHLQSMMTNQKTKVYDTYIDTVMALVDKIQHKKPVAPDEMKSFQESSVFINMHGSKHMRAMNEHIASLISAGKSLAAADHAHLKTELSKTIRADLI